MAKQEQNLKMLALGLLVAALGQSAESVRNNDVEEVDLTPSQTNNLSPAQINELNQLIKDLGAEQKSWDSNSAGAAPSKCYQIGV